jgi:hydrogenase maturation protein HypF
MTSGNISEEPIVIDNTEAESRLSGIADAFAHHNRRIHTRVDDSVVRVFDSQIMVQRRARGFAPQPVYLGLGDAQVLATGAELKSTLCLTRNGYALLSQHLGDLENFETLQFFEQTLERMQRLFHVQPQTIAFDLHPRYLSTQLAQRLPARRRIGVQHHHAHIASCMAEHHLTGQVIGVSWDGTGYGTDGNIWGGEFLVASLTGFTRAAHLRYVPLAGGDAAVREPWRMARSYLRDAFGADIPAHLAAPAAIPAQHLKLFDQLLDRSLNTIPTSSAGRLFDAVASLIGLRHIVTFEGQAAMELEFAADPAESGRYDFALSGSDPIELDLRPTILALARDLAHNTPISTLSARFHNTLAALIVATCSRIRTTTGESRVCLSGGCFQNQLLLARTVAALAAANFTVFHQRIVPANDGGIALGQAAIACEIIRTGA